MDTFHGCYEDTTHDYRHFAALYLVVRFINVLLCSILNYNNLYFQTASLLSIFTLALVARFQPYKCKSSNTVDMVMLLALICGYTSQSMYHAEHVIFPQRLNTVITTVSIVIPPSYMLFLILAHILPKTLRCFTESKTFVLKRMNEFNVKMNAEDQTLLNDGVADYNTCH